MSSNVAVAVVEGPGVSGGVGRPSEDLLPLVASLWSASVDAVVCGRGGEVPKGRSASAVTSVVCVAAGMLREELVFFSTGSVGDDGVSPFPASVGDLNDRS